MKIELKRSKRGVKRISVLAAFGLIILFGAPHNILAQWTTSGTNISNTNTGNVGVGTSSPAAKLDVVGASGPLDRTGTAAPEALKVLGGTGGNGAGAGPGGIGGAIALTGGTGGSPFLGSQSALGGTGGAINITGGTGGPNLFNVGGGKGGNVLINGGAGVANSPGNVILSNLGGNVGIGVSIPAFRLDVNGEINATGLRINGAPIATGGASQWTTAGSSIYYMSNVGIGTNSPVTKLHVAGSTRVDGTSGRLYLGTGAAVNYRGLEIIEENATTFSIRHHDPNVAWRNIVLNPYGGNIGIGTLNPGAKLDVVGTIRGGNGDTNIGNHPTYGSTYGAFWRQGADYSLLTDGTNTFLNAPVSTGNIYFRSANTDKLFLQGSTGNVGIGNTNPTEKLDIAGNIRVTGTGNITAAGAITGGTINAKYQDVAEWVESSQSLPAGTVVVLDHTKSNQVVASTQAYDSRVAGVISAQPGITLGESGEAKVLVATTGRVKIKVDATRAPIQVGDLLVTGDREGFAMKSLPVDIGGVQLHRPGTLVGKALEPLAKGTGEILVLLSLQ